MMFNKFIKLIFASFLFIGTFLVFNSVSAEPAYPERPIGYVNDYAGVLGDTSQLEKTIDNYKDSSTNEIAVVTVSTLEDVSIEEYALTLFEKWGIGREDVDNGVLLVVAVDDKKVRIEVGYGLEGAIPDSTAGIIIRNDITPSFSQGDYLEGVTRGVDAIMKSAENEYSIDSEDSSDYSSSISNSITVVIVIIIVVVVIILISRSGKGGKGGGSSGGKKKSYQSTSSGIGSSWGSRFGSSSGSSSSSSGSSFGGFGGGRSGGGGSSGSW